MSGPSWEEFSEIISEMTQGERAELLREAYKIITRLSPEQLTKCLEAVGFKKDPHIRTADQAKRI